MDLFPGDTERLMPHLEHAMMRLPVMGKAGIQSVVNGPVALSFFFLFHFFFIFFWWGVCFAGAGAERCGQKK